MNSFVSGLFSSCRSMHICFSGRYLDGTAGHGGKACFSFPEHIDDSKGVSGAYQRPSREQLTQYFCFTAFWSVCVNLVNATAA